MSILRNSFLAMSLSLVSCQYTDIRAILINNNASKAIKEKSIDESQMSYLKALELEPLLPAVHANLGSTYDVLKDPDKAMKLYKNAEEFSRTEIELKNKQPLVGRWELNSLHTTLFASLFNQGQLLARENKIDEALENYQAALDINPESKEVKTNIELLFQQQQGQGQGEGDSKNKDQNQDQKGKDPNKDPKDEESDKEGNKPKDYTSSPKYKPRDFKGDLTKENVQKIFGEISQQEKKMRTQFSKQNQTKEAAREKDW